jgi:hypothetical protein
MRISSETNACNIIGEFATHLDGAGRAFARFDIKSVARVRPRAVWRNAVRANAVLLR